MDNFNINRRRFLKGTAASLALTALGASGMDITNPLKTPRVALTVRDGMVRMICSG